MEKESKRKTKVATVLVCDTHATPPLCRDKHDPGIILMYPVPVLLYCTSTGGSHRSIQYSLQYSIQCTVHRHRYSCAIYRAVLLYHNLSYELARAREHMLPLQ